MFKKGVIIGNGKHKFKILRTKRSKEFIGEKLYVLEGKYGSVSKPWTKEELEGNGYAICD